MTRAGAPFRLKNKRKSDVYDREVCAASRCSERSVVLVDLTDGYWPGLAVPLCERHWQTLCYHDADGRELEEI